MAMQELRDELIRRGALEPRPDLDDRNRNYGINDDSTLRRFLTARKGRLSDAVTHFEKASMFRHVNRLAELYDGFDVDVFEETRNLYPHWTGRCCRAGQPIYVFDTCNLTSDRMAAFARSSAELGILPKAAGSQAKPSVEMLRAVLYFDHLTRFVMPLCAKVTENPDQTGPDPKMVLLVDLSGMGLRQIWNLKGYLQGFGQILSVNFPEILDRVFLTNAPSSFPWIWDLIKGWADPGTVSKIALLKPGEVQSALQERIAAGDLPQKYGGTLQHEHGMSSILEDRLKNCLGWDPAHDGTLPKGPMKWVSDGDGNDAAMAVGSINGQMRAELITRRQAS